MIRKWLMLISSCLLLSILSFAQCPDRTELYKRIIFLRDSSPSVSPAEKLRELTRYELKLKACSLPGDSIYGLLLQRIGAACFAQGKFLSAVRFTESSTNILNAGKPGYNDRYLLKNYSNLILYHDSLNNVKGKMKSIDSCIAIAMRTGLINELYLIALIHKVKYLFYLGDYSLCYRFAAIGEEASRRYAGYNGSEYLMSFTSWKVNTLINDRKYNLAENILHAELREALNNKASNYLGTIYELLAQTAISRGGPEQAVLALFQKAFNYDQLTGNILGCMQTLNNLGYSFYFKHLGNSRKALLTCKKALALDKKSASSNKSEVLNILTNIANIYVREGLYDSAFHYFQCAFDEIRPGLNESVLVDSLSDSFVDKRNLRYLLELVIDKGDAYFAQYKSGKGSYYLDEAIKVYRTADRFLGRIKMYHFEPESKLTWQSNSRRLYDHAVDACYRGNKAEDAFYFFERSRAVLLVDQLKELNWITQDDIFLQAALEKEIIEEENKLGHGNGHSSQGDHVILVKKQKLFQLQQSIKVRNPLYYQQLFDTSFITINDVQKTILKDHKALIEIFVGDSAVYSLIIKEDQFSLSLINKAEYDSTVNLYLNFISNPHLLNLKFRDFVKTSNRLYRLIFNNSLLPAGRIIISPDGRYFPFEALVLNSERSKVDYCLDKYAVSYTYSSRYLLNEFNTSAGKESLDFLGVAPVQYDSSTHLAPLYGGDVSVRKIQGYFPNSKSMLFKEASSSNFRKNFVNYKIIQLYTHASDSGSSGEPEIYFYDSTLHLSELFSRQKPATNLIVLSACNTATGKVRTGEGVFSLGRGFAALGIPASISSLWSIDNLSTVTLTELFYKNLDRGLPSDVALQQAKIELIEVASDRNVLPYYWAGTILFGKSDKIKTGKPVRWPFVLAAVCALMTALYFSFTRRKPS